MILSDITGLVSASALNVLKREGAFDEHLSGALAEVEALTGIHLSPDFTVDVDTIKYIRPIAAILEHSVAPIIDKDMPEHRQAVDSAYATAKSVLSAWKSKPASAVKKPVVGRIHGVARYDLP